jgi:hypothetical protein
MAFSSLAKTAAALSLPFGLCFLLAPEATAALYGVQAQDATLILMGRYFGSALLMYAAAAWALRGLADPAHQHSAALGLAAATASGLAVTLQGVGSGTLNALGWSSVALYAGFTLAWGLQAWPRLSRAQA